MIYQYAHHGLGSADEITEEQTADKCMYADREYCAALPCSVPAGDAGIIFTFNRKSSLFSAE